MSSSSDNEVQQLDDSLGDGDTSNAENAAPRCSVCAKCITQIDEVSSGQPSWEHIPFLETPEELIGFSGLEATDQQHVADLDGILAWYDFANGVRVPCSLKGRHPHSYGVVVRMLCKIIICMGKDCGKKSIVGFDAVHRTVKTRVQFQNDQRYLEGWPARYMDRIATVQRSLRSGHELGATIHRLLPELYAELARRSEQTPIATAVTVRTKQDKETRHLAGLELFRKSAPREDDLRRALAKVEQAIHDNPPVDGPSASALLRLVKGAEDKADAAKEWIRSASRFLTEENLILALIALGRDSPSVHVDGSGFRVGYMPGRSARLTF